METISYSSPVGLLLLTGDDQILSSVLFADETVIPPEDPRHIPEVLLETKRQLDEYFEGKRTDFQLPLDPHFSSSDFSREVWTQMSEIPYGETRTYKEIAAAVFKPRASQAVGSACKNNPLLIVVPCHRVVPTSGGIGQYAGGVVAKEFLLTLESAIGK